MSDKDRKVSDGLGDWMRLWCETTSRTMEAFGSLATNPVAPEACRETRSRMFQAWSDYWEQYLRSTPFLEAQKQFGKAATEPRKQIHDVLGQFYHELQLATAEDIDQVMRALRRLAEDAAEQHEAMAARLNEMAARLDALAASVEGAAQGRAQTT